MDNGQQRDRMGKYNPLSHIDDIIGMVEDGNAIPFTTKVSVDRDVIIEQLRYLKDNLPREIAESRNIINNGQHIIDTANSHAQRILDDANRKYKEKVNEHSITKGAQMEAQRIQEEAEQYYVATVRNANVYVREKLDEVNTVISRCSAEISKNITEIDEKTAE